VDRNRPFSDRVGHSLFKEIKNYKFKTAILQMHILKLFKSHCFIIESLNGGHPELDHRFRQEHFPYSETSDYT